jgi:regulatory protein
LARPGRSRTRVAKPLDCHERALRLLAVRPRSRRELQSRLLRAGFEPEEVESELARLEVVGLVDDEAFARQVVEHEVTARRSGRRAVTSRLYASGLDRQTIERSLEDVPASGDDERAVELARTRVGRLARLTPEQAFTRLVGFLGRRGYAPSTARHAARVALEVEGQE